MYEVIDEQLNIASCRLSDLLFGQVEYILSTWEKGAKIGSLTFFTEPQTNRIVLNADHLQYCLIKEIVTGYMAAEEKVRKELAENAPKFLKPDMEILERCIQSRRIDEEIRKAIYVSIDDSEREVLQEVGRCFGEDVAIRMAFKYGTMQGKRAVRAKKYKNTLINDCCREERNKKC